MDTDTLKVIVISSDEDDVIKDKRFNTLKRRNSRKGNRQRQKHRRHSFSYPQEVITLSSSDEAPGLLLSKDEVLEHPSIKEKGTHISSNYESSLKCQMAVHRISEANCKHFKNGLKCEINTENHGNCPKSHFSGSIISLSPSENINFQGKERYPSPIIVKDLYYIKNSTTYKENQGVTFAENSLCSETKSVPKIASDLETHGCKGKSTLSNLTSKSHYSIETFKKKPGEEKSFLRSSFGSKYLNYYNIFFYLERNQRLCVYRTTYFPFTTVSCKNTMSHYHCNLINSILDFESRHAEGLTLLNDFLSCLKPGTDLSDILNDLIFKHKRSRERNLLYSLSLPILQKLPNLIKVNNDKLRSILSQVLESYSKNNEANLFGIMMLIHAFEFNVFSVNMCDNMKLRHTLIHSLLSMDVGKSNIVLILTSISKCIGRNYVQRSNENLTLRRNSLSGNGKFLWLSSLQHLIHLGLLTTKINVISSVLVVAKDLRSKYLNLTLLQDKMIFLECIENPMLCLFTLSEILDKLSVLIPNGKLPSFTCVMESFCKSIYSRTSSTSTYEELVVLLYFTFRSIMTCQQEYCFELLRTRILKPSIDAVKINEAEKEYLFQSLADLGSYLTKMNSDLTPVTVQFLAYIECLLDS